jgi:hypothetical protein
VNYQQDIVGPFDAMKPVDQTFSPVQNESFNSAYSRGVTQFSQEYLNYNSRSNSKTFRNRVSDGGVVIKPRKPINKPNYLPSKQLD